MRDQRLDLVGLRHKLITESHSAASPLLAGCTSVRARVGRRRACAASCRCSSNAIGLGWAEPVTAAEYRRHPLRYRSVAYGMKPMTDKPRSDEAMPGRWFDLLTLAERLERRAVRQPGLTDEERAEAKRRAANLREVLTKHKPR